MPPIAAVEALRADLHDQPVNALRPNQIAEYRAELERLGGQVVGRDLEGTPQPWLQQAKGSSSKKIREIREVLDKQAPKKIGGERGNRVHALVKEIITTVLQPGMLPKSVMRRNPAGAVGHVMRTEFHPVFKDAILTVKRGMRALDPDNADPDLTNMERFRSEGSPDAAMMSDAQLPGYVSFSHIPAAHWPLDPPQTTAVAQVARREAAAVPVPKPGKRVLTAEQKAELAARFQRGREAKRAKEAGAA